MSPPAPLLLVHVTPASYRALPARLHPDDLASIALSAALAIDLLKETLTTLIEEVAPRCSHIEDARALVKSIDAYLTDLSGEVCGTLAKAGEDERAELYDGCAPGPMHRRRA